MKTIVACVALLCISLPASGGPSYRVGYFTYYSNAGLTGQAISELPTNLFTHIIYFYTPYSDLAPLFAPGQLEDQWVRLRDWAHAHDIKVLMCYADADLTHLNDANVVNTVHLLMQFISSKRYDGIDVDIETAWTQPDMVRFVKLLRDSLDARGGGHKYISCYATFGKPAEMATWKACEPQMDWVNVSAYDIVGSWTGYTSHFSPLFSPLAGHDDGQNINSSINGWKSNGYPPAKILAGGTCNAEMYIGGAGCCLSSGGGCTGGAALPGQRWSTPPAALPDVRFRDNGQYWSTKPLLWDSAVQSAYISIDHPGSAQDTLICFNDSRALVRKWQYAAQNGLGGVYFWDIAGTFESWKPLGQERWSIIRSVAKALFGDEPRRPTVKQKHKK